MPEFITIVETPRDAFQGLPKLVPTAEKIRYIETLLDAGFTHVDLGSFVSLKAMPQVADSDDVVTALAWRQNIQRLAIVVNQRGLRRVFEVGNLEAVGFPFSLAEPFQLRNTGLSREQSWPLLYHLIQETERHHLVLVVYLAMAFGGSDGEPWQEDALFTFLRRLGAARVRHVALADTAGIARPEQVQHVFERAATELPRIAFRAHLHSKPDAWFACVQAALTAGCRRFDATAGGLGGCPLAQEALVNTPSDLLAAKLHDLGYETGIDLAKLPACTHLAKELQTRYG
jgi:hydroxymethylglutaryl-CoA lyase